MGKKRPKLSKNKQKWVDSKPTAVMRGSPLNYSITQEKKYAAAINKILKAAIQETEREVLRIFKSPTSIAFYAEDASITTLANRSLDKLFSGLEKLTRKRAKDASEAMANAANKSSQAAVGMSLKELSGGVSLKPSLLGGEIREKKNAARDSSTYLIVAVVLAYLLKVRGAVNRSIMLGNGLKDLEPFMQKQRVIVKRYGRNVAGDQYRKAYASLNLERMKNAGVTKFEWLHSQRPKRPRIFHITPFPAGLNHGIYDIASPPIIDKNTGERGFPGQLPYCRCRAIPVIVLDNGEMV